jgi:hypothetical protein
MAVEIQGCGFGKARKGNHGPPPAGWHASYSPELTARSGILYLAAVNRQGGPTMLKRGMDLFSRPSKPDCACQGIRWHYEQSNERGRAAILATPWGLVRDSRHVKGFAAAPAPAGGGRR